MLWVIFPREIFLRVFLLTAIVVSALAQVPTASLVGRITDASGAVVPGVAIKVTNLDTNIAQSGKANEAGDYTISVGDSSRNLPLQTTFHLDKPIEIKEGE